jgi:hypothetical protein
LGIVKDIGLFKFIVLLFVLKMVFGAVLLVFNKRKHVRIKDGLFLSLFDVAFDVGVTGFLISNGHFYMGIAYIVSACIIQGRVLLDNVNKEV